MKKVSLLVLGLALLLSFQVGSAYADTPLSQMINELKGVKYQWAGTSTKGFDCSGFTLYAFRQWGIDLPHTSRGQAALGTEISKDELRKGDLVFFNTNGKGISHVGIYIGNDSFIHSSTSAGVTITRMNDSYYSKRYVKACRILSNEQYEKLITDPELLSEGSNME